MLIFFNLLQDPHGAEAFTVSRTAGEIEGRHDELLHSVDLAAAAEEKETHAFEIDPAQVLCVLYNKDPAPVEDTGNCCLQ